MRAVYKDVHETGSYREPIQAIPRKHEAKPGAFRGFVAQASHSNHT
jgi:hypothetical protein